MVLSFGLSMGTCISPGGARVQAKATGSHPGHSIVNHGDMLRPGFRFRLSGASSMISLGEATRMEIPMSCDWRIHLVQKMVGK